MRIEDMTARFGALDGETLSLSPGLNIIHAPNEGGKSTWCAFLRAMFYGMPTRERDKKGTIAEKNRYQPWSGAPMEGVLRLHHRGQAITLRRSGKPAAPFGILQATYTGTQEPVPGLTGETAGEVLLGASREVYERTAFVGQIGFDGAPELERRVAALASSGEEDVSYSETERRLRNWRNARRHNQTGALPRLETELAEVKDALARLTQTRRRMMDAQGELEDLEARQTALEQELTAHRAARESEGQRQYAEARAALDAAALREAEREQEALREAARLETDARDPLFDGMTPAEAVAQAGADAAMLERKLRGRSNANVETLALVLIIFGAVGAVLCAALAAFGLFPSVIAFAVPELALLAAFVYGSLSLRAGRRRTGLLMHYDAATPDDIRARAYAYQHALAEAATARARAAAYAQTRAEYEVQRAAMPDAPHNNAPAQESVPLTRTLPEAESELAAVRGELMRATRTLAMARGELTSIGDPAQLEARQDELHERITILRAEYTALTMAMEGLQSANAALQTRFSPALNAAAGEVLSALTGGRYTSAALTRDFEALGTAEGDLTPRRALVLSQGTADQLYLAVRLALCDLTLPADAPPPIVLDDALAHFDDARMALALDYLAKIGEQRQVLLFTCHTRELDYAAAHLLNRAATLHLP